MNNRESLIVIARGVGCECNLEALTIDLDGEELVALCPACPAWEQLAEDDEAC
jgi:hypothetical protein